MDTRMNLALVDVTVTIRIDAAYGPEWTIGKAMEQVRREAVEKVRSQLGQSIASGIVVHNVALTTRQVLLDLVGSPGEVH